MKNKTNSPQRPKNLSGVKEIAKRANVSIATVDRVIHNREGVSAKTKEKIIKIIEELDYQPNLLASRLASGKVNRIAALVPAVTEETDFWSAPLNGIRRAESEIRQLGIYVDIFLFNLRDRDSFFQHYQNLLAASYDGIILAPSFIEESKKFTKECDRKNIPYVFIDSDIPGENSLSYIGPPYYQSGYLGAKLLTYRLKGRNKILMVNIALEAGSFNYLQIENGFRAYFKDNQLDNEITRIDIHETDYESVARHLTYIFILQKDIEAVFVTNSQVATVASFLHNSQRNSIPLIGYDYIADNIKYLQSGVVDFLICHQPEDQGYRAVMSLYQHLVLGQKVPPAYYMPIDIITKENQEYYKN